MSAEVMILTDNVVDVAQATPQVAEARRAAIRGALEFAADLFISAYREGDAVALGYGPGQAGWEAYLSDSYGDLAFRLPAAQRRERVEAMARAGMTVRPIAATPGMGSKSSVANDLKALEEAGVLAVTSERVGVDGKRQTRKAPSPAPAPAAPLTVVDRVVLAAAAAGTGGVTTLDLMRRLKLRQGQVSPALSRAAKRGRVVHAGAWRDGFGVYYVPTPALEPAP